MAMRHDALRGCMIDNRRERSEMNKANLIEAVSEKAGVSKAVAEKVLGAYHATVVETAAKGEPVTDYGFGTFKVSQRAARTGRNPRTREPMEIPASKQLTFKAAVNVKGILNG